MKHSISNSGSCQWHKATTVSFLLFGMVNLLDVLVTFGSHQPGLMSPTCHFWYSLYIASRNFVGFTLLPVSLVFLIGKHARLVLIPVFSFCFIEEVSSLYARYTYRAAIESEWFTLLSNTSWREIIQFAEMSLNFSSLVGLLAMIGAVIWASRLLWCAKYPVMGKSGLLAALVSVMPFVVLHCLLINWHFGVNQMSYTRFWISPVLQWRDERGIRDACLRPSLPARLQTSVGPELLPDCVVVLGESATRRNWHLYGYGRNTTPCMDLLCNGGGGICFADVVSTQPGTIASLSLLLTDCQFGNTKEGHWTLAEVFNRAGYRCVHIANQNCGSRYSLFGMLFNGCDRHIDVGAAYEPKGKTSYDEYVLPVIKEELTDCNLPQLLLVHLAGAHYPVKNANPSSEKHFDNTVEPEVLAGLAENVKDRVNRYDDAMLYEDKVLGEIVGFLKGRERPAMMLYISDHGESPQASNWRIFTEMSVYEVPLVVWLSESYRKQFPETVRRLEAARDKSFQSDELTHGIVELGQILDVGTSVQSFLSPSFCGRKPRVVNNGKMWYNVD